MGPVSPEELRAICEKGLLLLAITIPEMEVEILHTQSTPFSCCLLSVITQSLSLNNVLQHILWPFLLKMIIPQEYTGAVATVRVDIF